MPKRRWLDPLTAVALLAGTALLCAGAWYRLFTTFAVWDDEGACAVALDLFLNSDKVLYQDFLNQYGPAYFFLFGGALKLFGLRPDADSLRGLSLLLWGYSGLVLGLLTYRLSRSRCQSLTALVATFVVTSQMINEPGHPQWLVLALLATLLGCLVLPSRPGYASAGLVTAALVTIKINVGAFVFGAVAWHLAGRCGKLPRSASTVAALALASASLVLVKDRLGDLPFLTLLGLTLVTLLTLAWSERGADRDLALDPLVKYSLGTAVGTVGVLAVTMLLGVSWQRLLFAVVGQHLGFGGKFWIPPIWSWASLLGAAVTLIALAARHRPLSRPRLDLLFGVCQLMVVSYLGCSLAGLDGMSRLLFQALPWSLALICLAPAPSDSETSVPTDEPTQARALLAKVGCLMLLYAYPVAGSQLGLSAVVGAVLAFTLKPQPRLRVLRLVLVMGLLLLALRQGQQARATYQNLASPSAFSTRLRLPEWRWLQMEWLVWNLKLNARSVVSFLGTYSVVNWSERPTAVLWIQSTWTEGLALDDVEGLLQGISGAPGFGGFSGGALLAPQGIADSPQVRAVKSFLRQHMSVVSEFGGTFLLQDKASPPWNLVGVWSVGAEDLRVVAPVGRETVERLELISWKTGAQVAFKIVRPEHTLSAELKAWELRPNVATEELYVRVWGPQNRLLARLPKCSPPVSAER